MKISVLSTSSRKAGGLFYSVRWLSKALSAQGCRPEIFSPFDEYAVEDISVWDPLPVHLYRTFGPLKSSLNLRRMLLEHNADLLHLHGIWLDNQWAAMGVQKKCGIPVVVSPRGMLDSWAVQNSAWKKRLVEILFARKALNRTTCIHALCRSEAESIRAYGLENPIALIPNGVELPEIGSRRSEVRSQNPAVVGKKRLLFLGRIHPKKGLAELINAWSKEDGAWHREWRLIIAGWDDGGHEAGLKELATSLRLADSVDFIGPQFGDEKEELLRSVDAFILPSFSEGLPMSVLEAWSFGLPVVMTEQCNLPEGFEADAALRIDPAVESIAGGLTTLSCMADEALVELGSRGRILVEKNFTWRTIAQEMQSVYEWCLGGEKPACIVD